MANLAKAHTKQEPKIVFVDVDEEGKKFAIEKSGKRGVWPLLFNGENFIGDLETCQDLNEDGELKKLLA